MTYGVLPVKSLARSKQRLAAVFTSEERFHLAWMLYRNSLGVLLSAEQLDKIVVVSSDRRVLEDAAAQGAAIVAESAQQSHSHSADRAAAHCAAMGARRVLFIPIDVPLLGSSDIDAIIERDGETAPPILVIVPSADGTGTNALFQTPPGVIPCRFGPGSFAAHQREAHQHGVAVRTASPPGLVFDIDDPGDVIELLKHGRSDDISRYLTAISATERAKEFLSFEQSGLESRP